MSATADALLESLIRFPSVSDRSNRDVSQWIADRLSERGFSIEWLEYKDNNEVEKVNVIGRRGPDADGGLAYFGHSDVVPAVRWQGPTENRPELASHQHPDEAAFLPTRTNQRIYGRGACDMKGSLASMLAAADQIPASEQRAPLTYVCTADEEIGFAGARQVAAASQTFQKLRDEQPLGIIGEPTLLQVVHAHKGIAGYRFISHGHAAHSSSRDGLNANLAMVPLLAEIHRLYELSETDPQYRNMNFDPPTLSWNFGVSDGATAVNITPAESQAWVFFRPMPGVDGEPLVRSLLAKAESLGIEIRTASGSPPVWVEPNDKAIQKMCKLTGCSEPKTVCYGTDGGQFTDLKQLLVMGPGAIAQAHTVDEWIDLSQLERGTEIYADCIRQWCC